jgi:Na+-transporting methylmalonyl-CoA/oxaloacetate decarboxylase gamma subunit
MKPAVHSLSMKTILTVILLACAFSGGACSRSDKKPDTTAQAPNPNLKSDADRLQQATAKAAEERKRAQAQQSPTPSTPLP